MKGYTTWDVKKLLDVDRNRLTPWLENGYINPSIQRATRTGTKNIFSRTDLYRIYFFRQLLEFGITRKRAAKLAAINFDSVGTSPEDYKFMSYFLNRSDSFNILGMELTKEAPEIKFSGAKTVLVIMDLVSIKKEVDAEIAKLD